MKRIFFVGARLFLAGLFTTFVACKAPAGAADTGNDDDDDIPAEEEVVVAPSTPGTLTVTPGVTSNSIAWTNVRDVTYTLYFKTSAGVTTSDTALTPVTTPYSHTTLTPGTTYFYKLKATNSAGSSELSPESNGAPTGDITAPTLLSLTPANASTLVDDSTIVATFDETMDTTSLAVTGTGAVSITPVWSTTTVLNDTVSLTGAFPDGTGKTIIINADDLNGNSVTQITRTYAVLGNNIVYVSQTTGDDANAGTHDDPKATVAAANTVASDLGIGNIRVARGTYAVAGPVVQMSIANILGGYDASDWSLAPIKTENSTILQNTGSDAGTSNNPTFAVELSSSVTLDGFTIKGAAAGTFTSGVYFSFRESFVLSNCFIDGGGGSNTSYGVYASNMLSGGSINTSTIRGGTGGVTTFGLWGTSVLGTVTGNTIIAGSGTGTNVGMQLNDTSSGTISNNTITGGSGTTSLGFRAVEFSGALTGNTLHGGTGSTSAMGARIIQSNFGNSAFTVTGNTIYGGTAASADTIGLRLTTGAAAGQWVPPVSRNKIHGGHGTTSATGIFNEFVTGNYFNNYIFGGVSLTTKGIETFSDVYPATVRNNTINGGAASGGGSVSAAFFNGGNFGTITNNILFTSSGNSRFCLSYDGGALGTHDRSLFKDCANGFFFIRFSSTAQTTAANVDALFGAGSSFEHGTSTTNLTDATDPNTTWSNNDYSLANSSSANVKSGGVDGAATFGFTTDIVAATRTGGGATGWSIGAFERD